MEVVIILICIAVVYFTLTAQKAILPEAENKHNHNFRNYQISLHLY